MNHAGSKSNASLSETSAPQDAARAVPTFMATHLLEKLIGERDAVIADKIFTAGRRA